MIEFIGFIIKLIFGGLLGGICNYNRIDSQNETSSMYSGGMIGIIGTISTSFGVSAGDEFSGFLLGIMIIASILISKTILNEIGIREAFGLIIGWFVGIGNILHGIILTLFLIFFLIRFTENKNEETE